MRRAIAVVVVGLVMLGGGATGLLWPARAQDSSGGVGIYELRTNGAAIRQVVDLVSNPLPTETFMEASIPYSFADLSSGSGHGLSSTFWPGDAAANFCAAFPELPPRSEDFEWYPEEAPRVPLQCWPVRAETFHPQGPAEARNDQMPPGSTMESKATATEVMARAAAFPQAVPGFSFGASTSTSTSTVKDGKAIAETISSVTGISLGDGAVKIDKVVSIARAVSDGATAEVTGSTVVSGMKIGDVPVTIDQNGVHIAGQSGPNPLLPGGPLNPVAEGLKQAGITIALPLPEKTINGSSGEITTGGLNISFDNAPFVAPLPIDDVVGATGLPILNPTGETTVILGQAIASANASPGFGEFLPTDEIIDTGLDTGTPIETPPVEDVSGSVEVAGSTDTATQELGSSATAPAAAVPVGSSRGLVPGKAVGPALVIMSLVGAGLAAFGLRKLATGAFVAGGATTCPLESS